MEEYEITGQPLTYTLKGLLRCIWEHFNETRSAKSLQIRFCVPSEIYNYLKSHVSVNRGKDFSNVDFLHWSPMELFRIAAHRYALLSYLYDKDYYDSELQEMEINTRDGVRRFWKKIIPETIINAMNEEEDVFAYIARHTQLLPRQVLQILSEATAISHRRTGGLRTITGEVVRQAVSIKEENILGDVFTAFRPLYPDAERICRFVIPRLPVKFTYGTLQKIWRETGRAPMGGMGRNDFLDFWDMFLEMGLMGLEVPEESAASDRYFVGRFEYNERSRINMNEKDHFLLHPLLIPPFVRNKMVDGRPNHKAVYPRGSGLEDASGS